MDEEYAGHGVFFRYPADWEITEQEREGEITITVTSPQTSFWSLSLFFGRPDPESIMEAVVEAFEEEYDELDVYPTQARVCERTTVARDIDFVCLELLNSAWARSFRTPEFTALVLYQAHDRELEETGPLLEGMTRSLAYAGGIGALSDEAALDDDTDFDDED